METNEKDTSFRNRASFGKRMEFSILAEMLAEGLDIYTPLVDDNGIDAVIRKEDGSFIEIQIKARSGNEKLFAAIKHEKRPNYWFIFRTEGKKDSSGRPHTWVFSSEDFVANASVNKKGKNEGKYSLSLSAVNHDKFKIDFANKDDGFRARLFGSKDCIK